MHHDSSLVVVVDGEVARFLTRSGKMPALNEHADWRMQASPEEDEGYFSADVADKIRCVMADLGCRRLVICAAPDMLGSLCSFLPASILPQLVLSIVTRLTDASADEIGARIGDVEGATAARQRTLAA